MNSLVILWKKMHTEVSHTAVLGQTLLHWLICWLKHAAFATTLRKRKVAGLVRFLFKDAVCLCAASRLIHTVFFYFSLLMCPLSSSVLLPTEQPAVKLLVSVMLYFVHDEYCVRTVDHLCRYGLKHKLLCFRYRDCPVPQQPWGPHL